MKVAFLIYSNEITGGHLLFYLQAHRLRSAGHQVTLLFFSDEKGEKVSFYPDFLLEVDLLKRAVADRREFDVVISTGWSCFYEMFELQSFRFYHIVSMEEWHLFEPRKSEGLLIRETFTNFRVGLLTYSTFLMEWLENEFDRRARLLPMGVDPDLFPGKASPLAQREDRIRLLILGPGRDHRGGVPLCFNIVKGMEEVEVWYVSTDHFYREEWGAHRTFFDVPNGDMAGIYLSCHILMKLPETGGTGNSLLEMMACGGTVFASDLPGYREHITHGESGFLVDRNARESEIKKALQSLVRNEEMRSTLVRGGLEEARRKNSKLSDSGILRVLEKPAQWNSGLVIPQDLVFYRMHNLSRKESPVFFREEEGEEAAVTWPGVRRFFRLLKRKISSGVDTGEGS